MAKLTYEQLQASFNRQMKGGQTNRVTLLRQVLAAMGHPEHRFRVIHIAGTNGKGSTGRLLSLILQEAGLRVGHFNSPAMVDQREQIKIDDHPISKQAFVRAYQQIVSVLPAPFQPGDFTIFEWWTLIMLQAFANAKIDWAVIEVGLGGTNDATNCIDFPQLAVITHLALDHTQILGPTIKDIAAAKAGIIKPGTASVVLAPHQEQAAQQVIESRAQKAGVPLVDSARQATVVAAGQASLAGQPLLIESHTVPQTPVKLRLLGDYQLDNLTTVLASIDCLRQQGLSLANHALFTAIERATLPGRFQQLDRQPAVVVDGAHNPDGARRLVESINHLSLTHQPLALVVGFLADKDVAAMVKQYQALPAKVFVATPDNPGRALTASQLARMWPGAQSCISGPAALSRAKKAVGDHGCVIVTGSFYLVKEVEELYQH
ncbi:folylpolyglutamate synthase/dihydrofolate synthase family protein [uncultured Limosilactobacillus sp.]|uniref:bifunctional folylpolyglutamate synthase/dihydrofolate synthase n=1 Tax=uncultured Limosilactobacillus sp. TaxID=2837629 RepID=UPI0025EDB06C|nr:folylpolyglutamate synthase/dihydrofolate synthase family protein [uncultured Limosilactobacillus sp.]